MGQTKFVIALVMISLFTLAVLNYSIGFANDNDAYISILDNPNMSGLNNTISSQLDEDYYQFNTSDDSFIKSTIKSGDDNLEGGASFKDVVTTPRKNLGYIMDSVRSVIFGNDPAFLIVIKTFLGVIILLGMLYIWKTWKGGNPE